MGKLQFFTGRFIHSHFLRLQSSISKKTSRDASKRSNNANPKIIDLTLEKVELKTAENAWKPTNRKEATNGDLSMVRFLTLYNRNCEWSKS